MDPSHNHDAHYNRKVGTYQEVGNAMGWAMAKLLKQIYTQGTKPKQNHLTRRAFALSTMALTALTLSFFATVSAAEARIPKPDGKPADMSGPVQVFILLGQSNMVGLGRISAGDKGKPEGSLEHAVKTKRQYLYLVDDAGNWSVRKDVRFVRMMQGKGLMNNDWLGVAQPEQLFRSTTIGPEFGIGHVVGNAVDAPVMILKSCIGNRALGWHLLPPGSARFEEGDKVDIICD